MDTVWALIELANSAADGNTAFSTPGSLVDQLDAFYFFICTLGSCTHRCTFTKATACYS